MDETNNAFPTFSPEGFAEEGTPTEDSNNGVGENTENLQSPPRQRKKKVSSDRRFDQLVYERGVLEQQNSFKDTVIADQQKQLQDFQNQLLNKEKLSNDYFETAVQEREHSLLRELRLAKEDGDIDAEVKLQSELADIKAKKHTNSLLQFQRQEQRIQEEQRINDSPYVPLETSVSSYENALPVEFQDWMEENPWYTKSPRMKEQADQYFQELSDRLMFHGQEELIGTPEFYDSVTTLMGDKYGNRTSSSPTSSSPPSSYESYEEGGGVTPSSPSYSINNVAPVNRRSMTMADQYVNNRNSYSPGGPIQALSKEEFSIARHLPVRKKGESETDLVRRYAQAKNYPKSPLPGGTPYRLTIV